MEILSNLSVWLQVWLQELGSGGVGIISAQGPEGASIELRVEVP